MRGMRGFYTRKTEALANDAHRPPGPQNLTYFRRSFSLKVYDLACKVTNGDVTCEFNSFCVVAQSGCPSILQVRRHQIESFKNPA